MFPGSKARLTANSGRLSGSAKDHGEDGLRWLWGYSILISVFYRSFTLKRLFPEERAA
jgi:hypothetical protein